MWWVEVEEMGHDGDATVAVFTWGDLLAEFASV